MNYLINKDVKNLINLAETNKTAGKLQQAKTFLKKAIIVLPHNSFLPVEFLINILCVFKLLKISDF